MLAMLVFVNGAASLNAHAVYNITQTHTQCDCVRKYATLYVYMCCVYVCIWPLNGFVNCARGLKSIKVYFHYCRLTRIEDFFFYRDASARKKND